MNKIIFNGYYGQLNTGDDAFCVVSDWGARKYWEEKHIEFFGNNLPVRIDNTNLKSARLSKNLIKGQSLIEMLSSSISNSHVIYAGGSTFHSEIKGLTKNNILNKVMSLGIVKVGAIGVSLGPYKNSNAYSSIQRYLSSFSFLALRDKRSYEEAMNMNLPIPVIESFDLAALLPMIYPISKNDSKEPVLGVSVCNYERFINGDIKKEEARFKKIYTTINLLKKRIPAIKIKIFIFNAHPSNGDDHLSHKLLQNISDKGNTEIVNYSRNTYNMWEAVSTCDVVLATRLHAGMFACFSNTPFLQIEYHKKCSDFLNDVNYPSKYRIGDFDVSEQEVSDYLFGMINNIITPAIDLYKVQEKALLNFTAVKL